MKQTVSYPLYFLTFPEKFHNRIYVYYVYYLPMTLIIHQAVYQLNLFWGLFSKLINPVFVVHSPTLVHVAGLGSTQGQTTEENGSKIRDYFFMGEAPL